MTEVFNQNPAYFLLASVGTLLYLLKMAMFVLAGDGDADMSVEDAGGEDMADGGDSFSLISTQSILAFLMGTGWIGLAAQREWHLSDMYSVLVAVAFGFLMMFMSAFLTFNIKKLNSTPKVDIKEAIGKTGRAYTNIPAKGEGIGQVEITVGGKQQILQASSTDDAINSFDSVKVSDVDDSGNLLVTKS